MARKAPQPAKLTRPRLHKAVARERLFAVLDEGREHKPAICVVGPPGAGKTTLVASWLDSRGTRGIWYQVDADDAELATFFYYLGEAGKPFIRKGQRPLPLLTPEYLCDVAAFSRRYFRELFSRLPDGATVVLDNYQEVADTVFHEMIASAVDEVRAGLTLVAISRRDPPACYSRLIANNKVMLLDWDELQLTLDEACAIGQLRHRLGREDMARLHERSGGWAAGLVLLLEYGGGADAISVNSADSQEAIFQYFAGEIFQRAPADWQHLLVTTALLRRVTPSIALQLSGDRKSSEILAELHRRHLFVYRRSDPAISYEYHALFREFLLARANEFYTQKGKNQLARRAAKILEETGRVDEAVELYFEAQDYRNAARLIESSAAQLLAQGRGQTLREWLGRLPISMFTTIPWLSYWFGTSLIQIDHVQARHHLEQVFHQFEERGDTIGQIQAIAGIVEAVFFQYEDFSPLDPWVPILEKLLSAEPEFPSGSMELRAYSCMVTACSYPRLGHPQYLRYVERTTRLLYSDADVNQIVIAGAFLLIAHGTVIGTLDRIAPIVARVEPLLRDVALTPLNRMAWSWRLGYVLFQVEAYERAAVALLDLERTASREGLKAPVGALCYFRVRIALAQGQFSEAKRVLQEVNVAELARDIDRAFISSTQAIVAMSHADTVSALQYGRWAIKFTAGTSFKWIEILVRFPHACALAIRGSVLEAKAVLREMRVLGGSYYERLQCEFLLLESYCELRSGDSQAARGILEQAFRRSREENYRYFFADLPEILPCACAEALHAEIEIQHVKQIIGRYGLTAPIEVEEWPWPVRIYALGSFLMLRDGEQIKFSRKAQSKPIQVLQALIVWGAIGVQAERLVDALWPDAEGDAGYHALETALYRLRKLLGHESALVLSQGKLSLNMRICWTDVLALDKHLTAGIEVGNTVTDEHVERVFQLYQDHLLANEPEQPWMLVPRRVLMEKVLQFLGDSAVEYERTGRQGKALRLYIRGLKLYPENDALQHRLHACQNALGNVPAVS